MNLNNHFEGKNKYYIIFIISFLAILGIIYIYRSINIKNDIYVENIVQYKVDELEKSDIQQQNSKFSSKNINEISYVVKNGDNLQSILNSLSLDQVETYQIIQSFSKIYKLKSLKVGQKIDFIIENIIDGDNSNSMQKKLKQMTMQENYYRFEVYAKENNQFVSYKKKDIRNLHIRNIELVIKNSLFNDAVKKGTPARIVIELINNYSYNIDFQRDLKRGDRLHIIFEEFIDEDGKFSGSGKILYANLYTNKRDHKIYYFNSSKKNIKYFSDKGKHIKRAIMLTPISGARISSNFGYRRHPVLGYTKLHTGIDFAAPTGTPIFAAGDGKIIVRKRYGSYGNYIKIKHNSTYSSAYAHMSRFNKKFRTGSYVKQGQIIGYVGTTGRSTGPHLHYEIIKKGKHVNPKKVSGTSSTFTLKNKDKRKFLQHKEKIDMLAKYTNII